MKSVQYILQIAALAPSVTSVLVVGFNTDAAEIKRVALSPEEYQIAKKGNFVVEVVEIEFWDQYSVVIMIGGGDKITVVEECHHDLTLAEVSGREYKTYDSPENIPSCFWFDYDEGFIMG